jgi:hypothetical protein
LFLLYSTLQHYPSTNPPPIYLLTLATYATVTMPATSRPGRRKCNCATPIARATPVTPPALSARRPNSSPPLHGNRASQPISTNASQLVNLDVSSCDTSPVQAMAETFESQLMGTQAVRPTNPSVIAGAATAEVASVAAADDASTVFGGAHLQDNFDGIDWSRLPRFMIPPTTPRSRHSWIYRHGYHAALISNPSRVFFICHYCHARKIIDCGGSGAFETTLSTSCSARHLEARKAGHGHRAPGRPAHFRQQDSYLRRAFNAADGSLSQATANSLSGFNIQRFGLAAVRWLVENNHPLRKFETPAFQQLIAAANPDAERALWASASLLLTSSLSQPQAVSASACSASLATCWSLAAKVSALSS